MAAAPPLHPRVVALLVLTVGVVGLGYNEWRVESAHKVLLVALFGAPVATLLGLAGLWEPRVLWSLGQERRALPRHVQAVGIAALVLGMLASVWLAFARYRIF